VTEVPKPKRLRRPAPPALAPGLYAVGRFGDIHDLTGDDWHSIATADLAAVDGYLGLVGQRVEDELERRAKPVEINSGFMLRQPDLRDVDDALTTGRLGWTDEEWLANRVAEGKPVELSKLDKAEDLPPSIKSSLDDLRAGRTVPVRRRSPEEDIIEETPVTTRPPMPWDNE
jgi:hypothetical protein